MIKNVTLSVV